MHNGRIIFPGIDLEKIALPAPEHEPDQVQSGLSLPFEVGKLQISNGLIVLRNKGVLFLIPFALQLHEEITGDSQPLYNISLQMMPQGEEVTLAGIIDLAGNKGRFTLAADSVDLNKLAVLQGNAESTIKFGAASIRGDAEISLLPFQLEAANLSVDPELLKVGKIPVRFGPIDPDAGSAISLELKREPEQLLVKARGFIREPLAAALEINGSVVQEQGNVQSSGNLAIRLAETMGAEKRAQAFLLLKSNLELQGDFFLALDKAGTWKAGLKSPGRIEQGRQAQGLQFLYDTISLQTGTPSFDMRGQGTAGGHEVEVSLAIPKVQASSAGAEISMPEAGLRVWYKQEEDPGRGKSSSATLNIALDSTKFQKNGLRGKADILLQGEMAPQVISGNNPLQAEGRITLANAEITERDSGIRVAAITGNIPWFWPQADREMAGEIKAP